ncbi:hypothetical protein B0H19DRAFT_1082997 [Mycena capillaripes]|nr:hypothetical protein B0H19DRAFT_1082997 [Mycena capillaripes]
MTSSATSTPRTSSSSVSDVPTAPTSVSSVESLSSATKEAIEVSSRKNLEAAPLYTRRHIILTAAQRDVKPTHTLTADPAANMPSTLPYRPNPLLPFPICLRIPSTAAAYRPQVTGTPDHAHYVVHLPHCTTTAQRSRATYRLQAQAQAQAFKSTVAGRRSGFVPRMVNSISWEDPFSSPTLSIYENFLYLTKGIS